MRVCSGSWLNGGGTLSSPPPEELEEPVPSPVAESSNNDAANAGNSKGLQDVNPETIKRRIDMKEGNKAEENERANKLSPAPAFTKGMGTATGA
jgi:hypothetical protein